MLSASFLKRGTATSYCARGTPKVMTPPSTASGWAALHRGARGRGQAGLDLGPRHDDVVDVDLAHGCWRGLRGCGRGLGRRELRGRGRRRRLAVAAELGERAAAARRAFRSRRGRRRGGPPLELPARRRTAPAFEPVDAFGQRLQRRARFAAGQTHQRDLEHEARVGGVGAAHVDDRLTERLEHAHQHRRAHLVAELAERSERVLGRVDPHPSARRRRAGTRRAPSPGGLR